ncbi:larval cuticle protein LCP-17-like isoform X2 [Athalia rosae]|nr:larval cuticle protein LCP-17-like isoform X2 [Athalia rosae]
MLFGVVIAAGSDKDAPIEKQIIEVGSDGTFENIWSGNGISLQEVGSSRTGANGEPVQVIQGAYSYTAPNGEVIKTTYISDEHGTVVRGAHLPTPPTPQELPEWLVKSLEWARAHPYDEAALLKKTWD